LLNCPITLADLIVGSVRTPATSLDAHARRYVGAVSDQDHEPIDDSEEIAYLRSTPVETVLGNHFFVLVQLAALQLSLTPPNLSGAQLVIDIIAAMLQAGGDRLGEHVELYRNALAEVQQLYVRAASTPPAS
jgi:hypothetical protein